MVEEMGIYTEIHITTSQFSNRISGQGFLWMQGERLLAGWCVRAWGPKPLPAPSWTGCDERHCSAAPGTTALPDTRIQLLLRACRDSASAWGSASGRTGATVTQCTAGIWCLHKAGARPLTWNMAIVLSIDHVPTTVALFYSFSPLHAHLHAHREWK